MTDLTLPEALLLIALDDEKGRSNNTALDYGLAAGILLELARTEAVEIDEDDKVAIAQGTPDDPLLQEALAVIADDSKRRKPQHWVERLPGKLKPIKDKSASRLVEQGVLNEERSKFLGLISYTSWPEADPAPERALRERLTAVLVQGAEPTEQEALLVSLLEPLDLVRKVVEREDRKVAKERIKEVKAQGPAAEALKKSVDGMQAAVMVAVMASTTAATAGASN